MPWRIFKILLTIMPLLFVVMIVVLPWSMELDDVYGLWVWGIAALPLFFTLASWLDHKEPKLLPPVFWRLSRFYWTLIFLLFVCVIVSIDRPDSIEIWGLAGSHYLGVAAMWLIGDYKNPLALASANTMLALLLAYQTYRVATFSLHHCSGAWLCELQNLLYALGGPVAAAIPWSLLSGGLLYASCRTFKRWCNSGRSGTTAIPNE
jgi:hypothetical protein